MGIYYIWIDSLCIIQDSKKDWEVQSSRMHEVYSSATLVIGATLAPDDEHGFLKPRKDVSKIAQVQRPKTSEIVVTPYVHAVPSRHSYDHTPFSSRGWTFQERLLARRYLSFEWDELRWECGAGHKSECGIEDNVSNGDKELTCRCAGINGSRDYYECKLNDLLAIISSPNRQNVYVFWYKHILPLYTARTLTYPSDKLPAISAVAKILKDHLHDDYLAGVWRNDIIRGLAWYVDMDGHEDVSRYLPTYRAPSWSWASVDGRISCPYWIEDLTPAAKLIHADIDAKSLDLTGAVSGGFIILRGRFQRGFLSYRYMEWSKRLHDIIKFTMEVDDPNDDSAEKEIGHAGVLRDSVTRVGGGDGTKDHPYETAERCEAHSWGMPMGRRTSNREAGDRYAQAFCLLLGTFPEPYGNGLAAVALVLGQCPHKPDEYTRLGIILGGMKPSLEQFFEGEAETEVKII